MSKTVDDLLRIFKAAVAVEPWSSSPDYDARRAGIAAVVRALRDEMCSRIGSIQSVAEAWDMFEDILGSDAGEKVAGSTPEGAVLSSSAEGEPPANPATDPAPACEWRVGKDPTGYSCYYSDCTTGWRGLRANFCPTCERPVKIVETNPAPAVCEWTGDVQFGDAYMTKCGRVVSKRWAEGRNYCSCGKPIKFTEAKT